MAESAAPFVECEQVHAGLAVNDIATVVEFYTKKLGFAAAFTWGDPPTFAGVKLDKAEIFLRKGTPDPKGCFVSFMVGDADTLHEFHRSQGVEVVEPIDDRPYGIRDYGVRDLHGYHLSFGHPLFNSGPHIKIERVDVPVRLEKRLAALLRDLAEHKRMSLNSCLEEMLLYTNDGVDRTHKQPSGISRS
jgi:catechol 2,3-dioxygenase-like lactoylglutathione lyase family enzyme